MFFIPLLILIAAPFTGFIAHQFYQTPVPVEHNQQSITEISE